MDLFWRKDISSVALDALKSKRGAWRLFPREFYDLDNDIESGVCVLVEQGAGEVERIVDVIAFEVKRPEDNHFFMQLGRMSNGHLSTACLQPGGKREHGERVEDATHRLLDNARYAWLRDGLDVSQTEYRVEQSSREKHGLTSTYRRTIVSATLHGSFSAPSASVAEPFEQGCQRLHAEDLPAWAMDLLVCFVHTDSSEGMFCAWLSRSSIGLLQTSEGSNHLATLLKCVGCPPAPNDETSSMPSGTDSISASSMRCI